jgi:hypothetical protein
VDDADGCQQVYWKAGTEFKGMRRRYIVKMKGLSRGAGDAPIAPLPEQQGGLGT